MADFNDGWTQEEIETAIAKLTDAEKKKHSEEACKRMAEEGGYFALHKNGKSTFIDKKDVLK